MSTTVMTSDDEKKAQDDIDDKHRTVDVELAEFGFTKDMYDEAESGVDPAYQAKARRLNEAFQEIGMGKYQVCVCIIITRRLMCVEIWEIRDRLLYFCISQHISLCKNVFAPCDDLLYTQRVSLCGFQ